MKHRNPIENFKQINKSILSSRNLRDQKLQDDKTLQKEMQTSTKALEQEAEIQISLEKYAQNEQILNIKSPKYMQKMERPVSSKRFSSQHRDGSRNSIKFNREDGSMAS